MERLNGCINSAPIVIHSVQTDRLYNKWAGCSANPQPGGTALCKSYDSRADIIVITVPHGGRWGWMMGQGCDGLWMCFMSDALTGTFQTTLEFNWSFVESAQGPGTLGVFTTVLSLQPISGSGIVVACGCGACYWWRYVCLGGGGVNAHFSCCFVHWACPTFCS